MTSRRVTFVLLAIAFIGALWWNVNRTADGRSCDDGRGVRVNRACFDLGAAVIDTGVDGVDDLRPLADFGELRFLEIDLEDLDGDLTGLDALTNLDTLIIRGDGETVDLASLDALSRLQFLQLTGFEGRNLAGTTLPVLEEIEIHDMTIDGLPTMEALVEAEMTNLEELSLDRQGSATDLSPLAALPLRLLHLDGFPIDDLTPLEATVTLEDLRLHDAPIDTLEPLGSLTGLRSLEVSEAELRSLDGIEALAALERVQLHRNPIRDLGPLSGLTGLTEVYLDETLVEDLTPLASLSGLTRLSLWGAPVTDIAALEGLPLISIDLNSTNVASVAPLAETTSLESLRIGSTAVTDLTPLLDLPNLARLVPPTGPGAETRGEVVDLLAA